jgi:hypothetical protein
MSTKTSSSCQADRVGERGLCPREPVAGGDGDPLRVPILIEGEYWSDEYENFK